jgi:oxygen-independent coproporphyrinogen III oxidase
LDPIAVYVHIPFCPTKCGYCDFNSYAMSGEIMERTTRATIEEIRQSPLRGRPAKTIFFGGGTPTFLEEEQLLRIFEAVLEAHPPLEGAEITSEANPGTVDMPKFRAMRSAGFNRISLGAQSFLDDDLVRLGRVHRAGEIERAVSSAREAGFERLNLDLMFALPGQTRRGWEANLERAIALRPDHLSLYCLTIEPNTAFFKEHLKGRLHLPDDETQVEMYEQCARRMALEGFGQYEISNWALPGEECRHNLCYWYGEEYAGYGPGAVACCDGDPRETRENREGRDRRAGAPAEVKPIAPGFGVFPRRIRTTNLKHPERYCAAVEAGETTVYEVEPLNDAVRRTERIMLGLRLNEGLGAEDLDPGALARLERRGWIDRPNGRIRLTAAGRHFCSEAALELI